MPKALIIVGPTAIGKTHIAIELAKKNQIPIISVDSRQVYKELTIGVAKPSLVELNAVKHIEIGSVGIEENNDVALYCQRVASFLKNYKKNVILAGGTGFYIKALIEGISELPKRDTNLREKLNLLFENQGIIALQAEYHKLNKPYPLVDLQNPQRLIRAIEMGENYTPSPKSTYLEGYDIAILGLEMPRAALYERINKRVDTMMENGLLQEAESLLPFQQLEALHTVGYTELFDYLNGKFTINEAVDKIKQHSRNYAKRQMTYFKRQLNVQWFDVNDTKKINIFAQTFLT